MFKFKMNDNNWTIEEKMQSEIQETMKQRGNEIEKGSKWFGITMTDTHQIFLDQDLHEDRKRNTLKHELTHCYIVNFAVIDAAGVVHKTCNTGNHTFSLEVKIFNGAICNLCRSTITDNATKL